MNVDRGYEIIQEVWLISLSPLSVTVCAPREQLFPNAVASQAVAEGSRCGGCPK